MTLTHQEAFKLRFQVLKDLQTSPAVEIDSRFIKPLFGDEQEFKRWLEAWSLKAERFFYDAFKRIDGTPIEWVEISYSTNNSFIFLEK